MVGIYIKALMKGASKVSPTIKSVKPSVPKTKLEKAKSKLAIAKQKTKASGARLKQTLFDIKQKATKRENKMGGGMMGRRFGYSEGSSKGKIPTTPKEKSLAKLAPPKDRITFGDVVAGRTKGKRMQARNGTKFGATRPRPSDLLDPNNPINKRKKEFKQEAKKDMK
tara:strand:+ start:57 stop:557 length:501 start_codon:yes stop_codon:yes gene_type:complete